MSSWKDSVPQLSSIMATLDGSRGKITSLPKRKLGILACGIISVLLFLHAAFEYGIPSRDTGPLIKPLASFHDAGTTLKRDSWISQSDYDIVIAHYDEDVNMMRESIESILQRLPSSKSHRVIIYSKGDRNKAGLRELLEISDEVVAIPNVGREGETYLNHIRRHYSKPDTGLAGHTIFMQPHVAWHWVFLPRLENLLKPNTGFMSFGPYINQTCGVDSAEQTFPRMADIYSAFRGDLCPPIPQLATWAGQFIVSKKRILENQLRLYENLRSKFHAPPEHWIWKEGWWNNQPSNPTLGHALERSWPVIFDCTNYRKAETCGEGHDSTCQCVD